LVARRQVATEVVKVLRHTKTRGDVSLSLACWADGYTLWPGSPPRARVVVGLFYENGAPPPPPPWAKVVFIPVE